MLHANWDDQVYKLNQIGLHQKHFRESAGDPDSHVICISALCSLEHGSLAEVREIRVLELFAGIGGMRLALSCPPSIMFLDPLASQKMWVFISLSSFQNYLIIITLHIMGSHHLPPVSVFF